MVFAHVLKSAESLYSISGLLAQACVLCLLEVALAALTARSITCRLATIMAVPLVVLHLTHEDGAALGVERT